MSEPTFAESAQKLRDEITATRQLLRDEHYPYDGDIRVYGALHGALRVLGDGAESFVKWAEYFPGKAPDPVDFARWRYLSLVHHAIKGELE
jgi:hypothetical protein